MKVRILGCSGAIARGCRTTSFLIDDELLVDAGTGVGDLSLQEMGRIRDVLLTHSHLDHVAALPLMLDAVGTRDNPPVRVHALGACIAALRTHVFNDVIWPDFTRLPSRGEPFLEFHELVVGQTLQVGAHRVEVLPAVHTVPAVGYAVFAARGCWVFSGDTGDNPAFWQRLNQLDVAALVVEAAFSSREAALARHSLHLSPQSLASGLARLAPARSFPVYVTHTKPAETDLILSEILQLQDAAAREGGAPREIRWLRAGQELAL